MNNQGFPRQARIIKTDDFSSVFSLRKRISGNFFAIHYQHNQCGNARLGMVVAKKVAKRSVDRNYMRRVLRELFRKSPIRIGQIGHLDIVIRVLKLFNRHDFEQVEQEFTELLFRLGRATKKNSLARDEPRHV